MGKHSQLLRSVLDLVGDTLFDPNRESVNEFVARGKLTPEQTTWAAQQRLIGPPSFARLRGALHLAGLLEVSLRPADHRETFDFSFLPGPDVMAQTADELLRLLIRSCRSAGFDIGCEDLCFTGVVGERITGMASTTSVNAGPPAPWQLPLAH
jgi:hypothetical protein